MTRPTRPVSQRLKPATVSRRPGSCRLMAMGRGLPAAPMTVARGMRPTSGFSSPSWSAKREGRPEGRPLEAELALGGPDAVRPRALLALLDVEADGLATAQTVEVERRIDATLMEEILLTIVGGNEPKSAVGNDLLDGALWHVPNSSSRTRPVTHRPVREKRIRAAREIARRPDDRR